VRRLTFWIPTAGSGTAVAVFPPHPVDGPAHLLGAAVLAHWHSASIYPSYYRLSWFPAPNLSATLLLAALIHLIGLRRLGATGPTGLVEVWRAPHSG
jgi:hypothetical protein